MLSNFPTEQFKANEARATLFTFLSHEPLKKKEREKKIEKDKFQAKADLVLMLP